MGYMFVMGACFGCKRVFTFSPTWVPSYQGEPVCRDCMERANAKRVEMGLEPHPIHPEAYEAEEVA